MKKRLRLKKWVKVVFAFIIMILLLIISEQGYRRAVDTCVSNGGDLQVCSRGLRWNIIV